MNKNQLMIAVCNWLADIEDDEDFEVDPFKTYFEIRITKEL